MKIGVMMGGISSEREVSLNSGKEIVENLDKTKYEVIPLVINKKEEVWEKAKEMDFIFLAFHGSFGEDGTVQGILETLNKPYSGCGPLSSALCMNKEITKKLIRAEGVVTADWFIIKKKEEVHLDFIKKLEYPLVVKPNSGGSSVGTFIVKNKEELEKAAEEALGYDKEVMIEKYIEGAEITCPILNGKMLPILSIQPKSEFFDYASKYSEEGAKEVVVELQEELRKKVEIAAMKTYDALKCSVYARVDIIIKEGEPFVLEVNTLPGMTKNSLFPKSAKAVGMSFTELLDSIFQYSYKRI